MQLYHKPSIAIVGLGGYLIDRRQGAYLTLQRLHNKGLNLVGRSTSIGTYDNSTLDGKGGVFAFAKGCEGVDTATKEGEKHHNDNRAMCDGVS